jgi:histidyl-tRNA synthetase
MKKADASGAVFAVIIGDDEAAAGEVSLKPLREAGDEQKRVKVDALGDAIMNSMLDWDETTEEEEQA